MENENKLMLNADIAALLSVAMGIMTDMNPCYYLTISHNGGTLSECGNNEGFYKITKNENGEMFVNFEKWGV